MMGESTKRCPKCGVEHLSTRRGMECRECRNARAREERKRNPEAYRAIAKRYKARHPKPEPSEAERERNRDRQRRRYADDPSYQQQYHALYRELHPERWKAHYIVRQALRHGELTREPCKVCGSEKNVHFHHFDYSKPLEGWWLCSSHHRQLHLGRTVIVRPKVIPFGVLANR